MDNEHKKIINTFEQYGIQFTDRQKEICRETVDKYIPKEDRTKAQKEEKFIVLKKSNIDNFFSDFTKVLVTAEEKEKVINEITWNEVMEAVANNNKYIICNQDEPYADLVWQIILMGEDAKKVN